MRLYVKNLIKKIPGAEPVARVVGLAPNNKRTFLLEMLPKDSIGAEIGVWCGDFTERLLQFVQPKELHLIDPWKHEPSATYKYALYGGQAKDGQEEMDRRHDGVCSRFKEQIRRQQVKIQRGYSTDMLTRFPDKFFDWVYIDGNHLYEYVKKDLELALHKTKIGGLVAGDDYVQGQWWKDGVTKAVDEFAKNPAVELIELRQRQFVFRRKA